MKPRTCLSLFVVWLFSVSLARAELRLVGILNGEAYEVKNIGAGRLIGYDGKNHLGLPLDASYAVQGDLRAGDARFVHFSPTYYLLHSPVRDRLPASQRPWFGYVRLVNSGGWAGLTFDTLWSASMPDGALAVLGWMVDGKIVHTKVHVLPSNPHTAKFRFDHVFHLTEEEAKGQGVVLVWSGGRFIAPRPWFANAALQTALEQMLTGNMPAFAAALERGINVRTTARGGSTLLEFAAVAGVSEAISPLIARGIKIDGAGGDDALAHAASKGRVGVVERLLDAGADLGKVALPWVVSYGHDDVARLLLTKPQKPYRPPDEALTQAMHRGYADIARLLLARGARESFSKFREPYLLMEQTKLGHTAMVKLLLERKVDPNSAVDGQAPLLVASQSRDRPLVEVLLAAGAERETSDVNGSTALLLATALNDVDCARALIAAGAKVTAKRDDGNTSLHYAAVHDSAALLQLLIEKGAVLDASGARSIRPLELALLAGAGSAARLLAARGARCDLQRRDRDKLIDAAVKLDVVEVVQEAIAGGWSIDTLLDQRWPALCMAEIAGATRVHAVLVAAGAKVTEAFPALPLPQARLDEPVKLLNFPAIQDPRDASEAQVRQTVEVKLIVDETGKVTGPRIHSSPHGRLSVAVLQVAGSWRLSVPLQQGRPVCAEVVVPISFEPRIEPLVDSIFVDAAPIRITRMTPTLPSATRYADGSMTLRFGFRPTAEDVRLRLNVGVDGHSYAIRVMDAKDRENGLAALEALPDWAFTPGTRNGVLVDTRMDLDIDF